MTSDTTRKLAVANRSRSASCNSSLHSNTTVEIIAHIIIRPTVVIDLPVVLYCTVFLDPDNETVYT